MIINTLEDKIKATEEEIKRIRKQTEETQKERKLILDNWNRVVTASKNYEIWS